MKQKLLKRFEDELNGLERELHMELPKEIQRARELGDLRENAEYQAAKERQTYVNARIAMLKRRMSEIALMNMDRIPHGKAGFGSRVTIREKDHEFEYQLVMPEDADAEKGFISTSSPIGRQLLNKEEGGRHTPFFTNYRPQFYFRTTDVTGICNLPSGVEMVMPGDNIKMSVELIVPIAMDQGLRFAIREGGRTVGSGVVAKIIE